MPIGLCHFPSHFLGLVIRWLYFKLSYKIVYTFNPFSLNLFWECEEKITANQLIHLIIRLYFPFSLWWHVPRCSYKCLSQAFPSTYLHRALTVWAACQDFHSFYKYIKNTLQPLLQIYPCALLCHSCISILLNSLAIPLMPLKWITQFTSAVASQGSYCQVLWCSMPSWSQRAAASPYTHTHTHTHHFLFL